MKTDKHIGVLVVDDTIFYRKLLSGIITEIDGASLMGVASNGAIALKKIELARPDLVLLDMVMPGPDGLDCLKTIRSAYPDVEVVMVSGAGSAGLTIQALEAGALDFIPKPKAASAEQTLEVIKTALAPVIGIISRKKADRNRGLHGPGPAPLEPGTPPANRRGAGPGSGNPGGEKRRPPPRIDVVVMAVSTGGPNVLKHIIPALDGNFPVPILAVQHMPPLFTASLAESLDRLSAIRVEEAKPDGPVENGVMYIAPGGRHMMVKRDAKGRAGIALADSPPVHNCRPAADVLFRSVAGVFGKHVLAVVLTGMGSDGALGMAAIRRKGGYSLVQDEKTSVVWGMPGAVAENGHADEILPDDRIAGRIAEIVMQHAK